MGAYEHGVTLINRLRPAPLESLGSLLERLRVANHYQERRWLDGVLGRRQDRPEVLRRTADFQRLGALTGLDRETLLGLTLHRFAPWYGVDRWLGRPLPAEVDYLAVPLWPDIGAQGHTREGPAVCTACWGERAVILLPWWLHQLTACSRHLLLLRQRCAGCGEPLRLVAGQAGCGQCGYTIADGPTRSIAADPDSVAVTTLLWGATGCVDGPYPPEGLTLAAGHPWQGQGTPALLSGLWECAQALVAGDGGPRLQGREIGAVHEALGAAWQRERDGIGARWGGGMPADARVDGAVLGGRRERVQRVGGAGRGAG